MWQRRGCVARALLYNPDHMAPTRSALLTAVLLLAGAACSGNGGAASKASTKVTTPQGVVLISLVAYKPGRIEVPVGKEVVWTVEGGTHTVVADDYSFSSPIMSAGEFRHTFAAPGTYAYHCVIQTRMKGTVVVTG
jgi:plastocyanin